jgi:hypothetical protein
MKRRFLFIFGLALALLAVGLIVRHVWEQRMQHKREVAYQTALQSYSATFRPGTARKDVEAQLKNRGVGFQQIWGPIDKQTASVPLDLVQIGRESAPWYCSEQDVYIAFEFATTGPRESLDFRDSDVLKAVTVYKWLQGCL